MSRRRPIILLNECIVCLYDSMLPAPCALVSCANEGLTQARYLNDRITCAKMYLKECDLCSISRSMKPASMHWNSCILSLSTDVENCASGDMTAGELYASPAVSWCVVVLSW